MGRGRVHRWVIVCLLGLSMATLLAAEEAKPARGSGSGLFLVPVLYYTPETRVAGGLTGLYYFRTADSNRFSRPSNLRTALIYTQNKQVSTELYYTLYLKNERYQVNGMFKYADFPAFFYGIGNDTPKEMKEAYTTSSFKFQLKFQFRLRPGWFAGLNYEMQHIRVTDVVPGRLLDGGAIPGTAGGLVSGLGFSFNYDTRDNVFSTQRGALAELQAQFFTGMLGSRYDFSRCSLELRRYYPLFRGHSIAVQYYLVMTGGTVPFTSLAQIGGQNLLRGFYLGRFRDKNLMSAQLEYRFPVIGPVGLVAFGGLGQVAPHLSDFHVGGFKAAFGCGIRYAFKPQEGLKVRLDMGVAEGKPAFYITINEAF